MSTLERAIHVLSSASTIAVVGLSRMPGKSAHDIPQHLASAGITVVGVNPLAVPMVESIPVVPSIHDVEPSIDICNVFRPSADTDAVIDAAIERHLRRGDVSCVWLQQGITNPRGADRCAEVGITYIEDTCISVVHAYVRAGRGR